MTHKCKEVLMVMAGLPLLLLAGCRDSAENLAPSNDAKSTIVLAETIDTLNYEAVNAAFTRLSNVPHLLTIETEEQDAAEVTVAKRIQSYRTDSTGRWAPLPGATAEGSFSTGTMSFLRRSDSSGAWDRVNLQQVLSDRPEFAEPRWREHFVYTASGDTVVSGEVAHRFTIRALAPVSRQPIRNVELAIAASDSALLYVSIERHDKSIFYEEESRSSALLERRAGQLMPAEKRVNVLVDVPFEPPRRFLLRETYVFGDASEGSTRAHD